MSTISGTDRASVMPRQDDVLASRETDTGRTDTGRLAVDLTSSLSSGTNEVIALVEETVRLDKRIVEGNRVRVSTRTETMDEVLRESLRGDAVGVTRVPIDRVVAEGEHAPQVRTEAGVTIIPVMEEVLVVEKRLVLREEIHIRHTSSGEDVEVPVTLRKQHAVIEHLGPDGQPLQPEHITHNEESTR